MDTLENKTRMNKVYNQLLEIAQGNFSSRIERTDKNDEIEALALLVNIISEEIQDSFFHQGFVNTQRSYSCIVQMVFLLDNYYLVKKIDSGVTKILQFEEYELLNKTFDSLLADGSKKIWADMAREMMGPLEQEKTLQLSFLTKGGLLYSAYCNVIYFPSNSPLRGGTVVTCPQIVLNKEIIEEKQKERVRSRLISFKKQNKNKSVLSTMDIEIIRKASEYMEKHLDAPLPVLKDLAHTLGTNEFKLKWGFKQVYGMTITKFLKDLRLRKAHVLVMYTKLPIYRISPMVGFKKGNHLSREFKKRYGYYPTELRALSTR